MNRRVWLLVGATAGFTVGLWPLLRTQLAGAQDARSRAPDAAALARVDEVAAVFRHVAAVAGPGVVQIRVEGDERRAAELAKELKRRFPDATDAEINERVERQMRFRMGSGSGIVLDDRGHILTNNHVVENRTGIRVLAADGREFPATIVGTDSKTDLAVIRVEAGELSPLTFGDSDRIEVGDWVIAIGAPFGLSQTVTHGIVSAKGRSVGSLDIAYQDFIQTDASINPGNSGGPLLSTRGEVIGVNTAIASDGDLSNMGIAFAIPANMARNIARKLVNGGRVERGWLGVRMDELSAEDAAALGIRGREGVLVFAVMSDTPASLAGLQPDDVIVRVGAEPARTMSRVRALIADVSPGESLTLGILRDGRAQDVRVEVGEQPEQLLRSRRTGGEALGRRVDSLGMEVRVLRPSLAREVGFAPTQRGLIVLSVDRDRDADAIDANRELIVGCNGRSVQHVGDLEEAIRAAGDEPITLRLLNRGGESRTLTWERQSER
ncbi:MAG: trypsin-like peptidase domain-containing protein [Phycisphaerales bacterium]|nr:trypsin-like peptidase domain-containing protein [Phycisphaerales bacterium]